MPDYKATWDKYCGMAAGHLDARGQALRPLSYPSFVEFAKRLKSVRDRRGKRAAYQQEDIYARLDMSFPVHGVMPHDVLYVDHTIANMALTAPHGGDWASPRSRSASMATPAKHGHSSCPMTHPPQNRLAAAA
jgi:hypothetical protein